MLVYNIVTNNIFFYLGSQKDIARIDVWMLYPEIYIHDGVRPYN